MSSFLSTIGKGAAAVFSRIGKAIPAAGAAIGKWVTSGAKQVAAGTRLQEFLSTSALPRWDFAGTAARYAKEVAHRIPTAYRVPGGDILFSQRIEGFGSADLANAFWTHAG